MSLFLFNIIVVVHFVDNVRAVGVVVASVFIVVGCWFLLLVVSDFFFVRAAPMNISRSTYLTKKKGKKSQKQYYR